MLDLNTGIDVLLPYRVIRKHSTDRRPGIQQKRIHIKRQYAFIHQRKNAMAYRLWRNKVQKSLNIISFTITAEVEQINPFKLTGQNIQLETRHQFLSSDIKSLENKINNFWQAPRIIPPVSRVPASTVWHEFLVSDGEVRRGSRILKWGVNFCNNVLEPINIWGIRKKKKEVGSEKGGWKFTRFTSPGSAPAGVLVFILPSSGQSRWTRQARY